MTRISTHVFSTNKTAAGSKFELMHHDDYLYTRPPTSHSRKMKRKEFAASHLGSHCVRKLVNALSQVKPLEGRQPLCKVCQHWHDLKILIYPDCHRWMSHLIWQSQSWSAKESNSVGSKSLLHPSKADPSWGCSNHQQKALLTASVVAFFARLHMQVEALTFTATSKGVPSPWSFNLALYTCPKK
jgi:hypothetical protein